MAWSRAVGSSIGVACWTLVAACGGDSTEVGSAATAPVTSAPPSAAAQVSSPEDMLDCPADTIGVASPGYDWEELGQGSTSLEGAVQWFAEQMPDEPVVGDTATGSVEFASAVTSQAATWIPVRRDDGRITSVLVISQYGGDQGYLVEGAARCETG